MGPNLGEEAALGAMLTLTVCVTVLKTDRCGSRSALGGSRRTWVVVVDVQPMRSPFRRRSPQMLDDMTVQLQAAGRRHQTASGRTGASLSAAGCHSG